MTSQHLLEKSKEEIIKNATSFFEGKFPSFSGEKILQIIEELDPSPSKKYIFYICKYMDQGVFIREIKEKVSKYIFESEKRKPLDAGQQGL